MQTTEHPTPIPVTTQTPGEFLPAGTTPTGETKLVLTVTEAAKVLGISRGLAYQLVRQGVIPTIRLGRRLVVPKARLTALLGESQTPAC